MTVLQRYQRHVIVAVSRDDELELMELVALYRL